MKIVKMTLDELKSDEHLLNQMLDMVDPEGLAIHWLKFPKPMAGFLTLALEEDRILGWYACLRDQGLWPINEFWVEVPRTQWFVSWFVRPEHRKQGIARKLTHAMDPYAEGMPEEISFGAPMDVANLLCEVGYFPKVYPLLGGTNWSEAVRIPTRGNHVKKFMDLWCSTGGPIQMVLESALEAEGVKTPGVQLEGFGPDWDRIDSHILSKAWTIILGQAIEGLIDGE